MAKVSHDVSTQAGSIAADKERSRLYEFMQNKTPTERYAYLTNSGWKQLGKEKIKEVISDPVTGVRTETGKEFVRVSWQAPDRYNETRAVYEEGVSKIVPRLFNQKRALLYEIGLDMERNGYVYRSDHPAYITTRNMEDNVVALVTA
jgi:hypothetical protein